MEAREARAMAERLCRWLGRWHDIPVEGVVPLHCTVYRLGDAIWLTRGGEPDSTLQTELRRRFPNRTILCLSPLGICTWPTCCRGIAYGLGLYQEEPSIPAPGCLEVLIDAIAERVAGLE